MPGTVQPGLPAQRALKVAGAGPAAHHLAWAAMDPVMAAGEIAVAAVMAKANGPGRNR